MRIKVTKKVQLEIFEVITLTAEMNFDNSVEKLNSRRAMKSSSVSWKSTPRSAPGRGR